MQPSRDIQAEMDSVEFYKTKDQLMSGTYQVNEHDGDISYAVVDRYSNVTWYSSDEYEEELRNISREQYIDHALDRIMRQDEIYEEWDRDALSEEGRRRADEIQFEDHDLEGERWNQMIEDMVTEDSHALDDSRAVCAEVAADKSIGDLLREFYVSQENKQ